MYIYEHHQYCRAPHELARSEARFANKWVVMNRSVTNESESTILILALHYAKISVRLSREGTASSPLARNGVINDEWNPQVELQIPRNILLQPTVLNVTVVVSTGGKLGSLDALPPTRRCVKQANQAKSVWRASGITINSSWCLLW